MKPEKTDTAVSKASSIPKQIVRQGFIVYLLFAVLVPAFCLLFGWRSLEAFGTGFTVASVGLVIFGVSMLAGNSIPTQISSAKKIADDHRLPHQTAGEQAGLANPGLKFFLITLAGGVLLGGTGLLIKLLVEL